MGYRSRRVGCAQGWRFLRWCRYLPANSICYPPPTSHHAAAATPLRSPSARAGQGLDIACFGVDWDAHQMTCPAGQTRLAHLSLDHLSPVARLVDVYVTNAVVVVAEVVSAVIGWQMPAVSLMFPALALINAIFCHVGLTLVLRRFSPGLITAVLVFLPISSWCYVAAAQDGQLSPLVVLISLFGGAAIMAYPASC